MAYSVVHLDEIDPAGPGGAVRFVRRELGVGAFGINWFELPPDTPGLEHDEADTGQEEVNVIVRGSGVYRIDGAEIPVSAGTFLRFDPGTTRQPVAGPDGPDHAGGRRAARQLRAARPLLAERRTLPGMHAIGLNDGELRPLRALHSYLDDFG